MPQIDQSARSDVPLNTPLNTNVPAKITSVKFVSRFPDVEQGGRKKSKGHERWEFETDGFGHFEADFEIPAQTHHMKDLKKRAEKVEALAMQAAKEELMVRYASHVN